MRYLVNCFLLMVPLLAFDALFANRLPAAYQAARWNDVPVQLAVAENTLRLTVMLLSLLMPISFSGLVQRTGAVLYAAGVAAYVAAWMMQISRPHAAWSTGLAGFLAPAWTPALWLAGIGLIGAQPSIPHAWYVPWIYLGAAAAFLTLHNLHAGLVHQPTA